ITCEPVMASRYSYGLWACSPPPVAPLKGRCRQLLFLIATDCSFLGVSVKSTCSLGYRVFDIFAFVV
ncbi:hypothetical protein QUB10_12625, partial [Microcoleus sp. B5-D4]|uniref:hypothetical protein n=1 Tax=unclassified Microcoleus TaxID=2642155 RepID=UPI002FD46D64